MKIDVIDKVSCFSDLNYSRIHSHLFFNQKDRHLSAEKTSWSTFKTILLEMQMAIEFCKYFWRIPIKVPIRIPEKKKIVHSGNNSQKENLRASHNGGKLTFLWKKSCNKNLPGLSLGFDLLFFFFSSTTTGSSMAKCRKENQYFNRFWWILEYVMAFIMIPRL